MKRYLIVTSIIGLHILSHSSQLSTGQKKAIGMQIWQNEAGQKYDLLVFWNPHEAFPSLGIGHFIWYPAGEAEQYTQTFPQLLDYFTEKKIKLPAWLAKARRKGAPWKNYEDFKLHAKDAQTQELRKLLFNTIDLQLDFIIKRLDGAWQHIQKEADPAKRSIISRHFKQLSETPSGLYALIDYLNFKGEGTNSNERYNGKGWGLLQVLQAMPSDIPANNLVAAFAQGAEQVLKERVNNAPSNKSHEHKWLNGWYKRINTYRTFKVAIID